MKKSIVMMIGLAMAVISHAQPNWQTTLNEPTSTESVKLGTKNNFPINFYTNDSLRMSLCTSGLLKLNKLACSPAPANRFLKISTDGTVSDWKGAACDSNKILFGDNKWRSPFSARRSTLAEINDGRAEFKLGIGITTPLAELDVNGATRIQQGLSVNEALYMGPAGDFGVIRYTPAANGQPAIFNFGSGSGYPGSSGLGHVGGGHGGGEHTPDPPPNFSCTNGSVTTVVANVFKDVVSVKKLSSGGSLIGNINVGHNGVNGFIETVGTNTLYPNAGDLLINTECSRNIYAFSNGSTFAGAADHVMSVAGRMNVTQNMQIGGGTSLTNFLHNTAALFINAPASSAASALRIYHGGGVDAGVKIIETGAARKAFAIHNGSSNTVDGNEMFSIQGDGKTTITSTNTSAFSVISGNAGPTVYNVGASGYTEIKTANAKALSIYNTSNSNNNETFFVNNNGYTEIRVYGPSGMPSPYSAGHRAMTVRDATNGKDLFVVNSNGKIYAREVEISLTTDFPDYVFEKDYQLKPISEVETYIKANKHLPGFEKAAHYEKNGINVNDLFIKQQEKIEELTLYIIQLEKRLQSLENK